MNSIIPTTRTEKKKTQLILAQIFVDKERINANQLGDPEVSHKEMNEIKRGLDQKITTRMETKKELSTNRT